MVGRRNRAAGLAPAAPIVGSADFIVIDVETGNASESEIDKALNRWKPAANAKDEKKIEDKREDYADKIREKSALLDAAPITVFGTWTKPTGAKLYNSVDTEKYEIDGVTVISCGSETGALEELRSDMDKITHEETAIVGFNVFGFDLPKVRMAYVRNHMRLPRVFAPRILKDDRQPTVDLMQLFLRYFTSEKNQAKFISLDEVADRLGLPRYKHAVDGARAPQMVAEAQAFRAKGGKKNLEKAHKLIHELLTYNSVDILTELHAHLRMMSLLESLK